jgi:hypothetical protein
MKKYLLFIFFIVQFNSGYCQGFFTSAASGDWNNPLSWTLVTGTSVINYPVAGDSVIVLNAQVIQVTSAAQCQSLTIKGAATVNINSNNSALTITNDLLITETSFANISAGLITVTGNLTVNQKAIITQTGGAVSIFGLAFINAPSASAGNTILNIDDGVFSCIGGMAITATTIPAGRIAEIKIGNSTVNIFGTLTTISANAKISFTAAGSLTLAGIITIPNPLSFSAGNGRVVYVGIPGANQTIAPLTYNRLVITGIGNGNKTINGSVVVTDSLVLLSDTLVVNNTGTLTLNNNATIVKTAGKLLSAPIFSGQADVVYNNVQRDTAGFEMPVAANVVRNLVINNIAGVKLGAAVTLNNKLTLQNGELFTDNFLFTVTNAAGGITTDPAIEIINGYVNGKVNRIIGTTAGVRVFPFGINITQGYREYKIDYTTAPTAAGVLSVQHFNTAAGNQSGFPLADGAINITNTQPYYWQADASGGLSGGIYNATLAAEGSSGITDYTALRILKRPSAGGNWILNGTAGSNTGSNNAPVVIRNGMSGFSQFAIGNNNSTLPLTLLSFTGIEKNGNVILNWKTGNEINSSYFGIEKSNNSLNFTEAGRVTAVAFSAAENNYQYQENNLTAGKYYYRLKIVDKDGRFTYSPVVSLVIKKNDQLLVYPTVSNSSVFVSTVNNQNVYLYNSTGQLIKHLHAGQNDISDLVNGLYVVRMADVAVKIKKE